MAARDENTPDKPGRVERAAFVFALSALVVAQSAPALTGQRLWSPADWLAGAASLRPVDGGADADPDPEPRNRLLTDPVLQFEPWSEFERDWFRRGFAPLWNDRAGGGAPLWANAQSAPLDPFQFLVYVAPWPEGRAWSIAARMVFAGFGAFLFAASLGLGRGGRWFVGLTFPHCGFLALWRLYPVFGAAAWLPWCLLAGDRTFRNPSGPAVAGLAVSVAGAFLAGHVQTSASILMCATIWVGWSAVSRWRADGRGPVVRGIAAWASGVALGLGLSAPTILPLRAYLAESPVWEDRAEEFGDVFRLNPLRWREAVQTAFPLIYGSQRAGDVHLARAAGIDNLNESAGGFVGFATLAVLAPIAWGRRRDNPVVRPLACVGLLGAALGFAVFPFPNLARLIPVLDVMDLRRFTLWTAWSLCVLGGIGWDALRNRSDPPPGRWRIGIAAGLGLALLGSACALATIGESRFGPRIREHYEIAARGTPGADPASYRARADRQIRALTTALPARHAGYGAVCLVCAALLAHRRRGSGGSRALAAFAAVSVAWELAVLGVPHNPLIDRRWDRPESPVIDRMREILEDSGSGEARFLALGDELPPNLGTRLGLADLRNYDSIESLRVWRALEPLFGRGEGPRTSRRAATWSDVVAARETLEEAGVRAILANHAPPEGAFEDGDLERVGDCWVARLRAKPLVEWVADDEDSGAPAPGVGVKETTSVGRSIAFAEPTPAPGRLIVRFAWMPGWRVRCEPGGVEVAFEPREPPGFGGVVAIPAGTRSVEMIYDPIAHRVALRLAGASALAALALFLAWEAPKKGGTDLERSARDG